MLQKNKNIDWKNGLCNHEPDHNVWLKIEAQLNFDAQLAEQIQQLPRYTASETSWEKIEAQLSHKSTFGSWRMIAMVAACITAIVVFTTLFMPNQINDKQSDIGQLNNALNYSEMEQMAITEINNFCKQDMPTCQKNNFKELMQLYHELKNEETELKIAIQQLGDSPEMIQALIKIENMKSDAIQNMIMLIQS